MYIRTHAGTYSSVIIMCSQNGIHSCLRANRNRETTLTTEPMINIVTRNIGYVLDIVFCVDSTQCPISINRGSSEINSLWAIYSLSLTHVHTRCMLNVLIIIHTHSIHTLEHMYYTCTYIHTCLHTYIHRS